MKQHYLPGANPVVIMGIVSLVGIIPLAYFHSLLIPLNIIFGLITLVQAKKARKLYQQHPERYTGYGRVEIGRVLAYIGITFTVISILFMILLGWSFIEAMNRTYQ